MPLRRMDPLQDLLSLQERMNRLFEESLKGRLQPTLGAESWVPLADVYETADAFVVLIELPGLSQDDIEVQVDGEELTIRGERQMGASARPESFHRMERSYGLFSRSFRLTEDADPSRLTAQFRDGLLRLEVSRAMKSAGKASAERRRGR
jgi:HSP20 family protein